MSTEYITSKTTVETDVSPKMIMILFNFHYGMLPFFTSNVMKSFLFHFSALELQLVNILDPCTYTDILLSATWIY